MSHAARDGVVVGSAYNDQTKAVAVRARECDEFMVAVSGVESSPLSIAVGTAATTQAASRPATQPTIPLVWETCLAGKLTIPLMLTRRAEFNGPMTLKAAGHPLLGSIEVSIEPKAESAKLDVQVSGKMLPGDYMIYAEGQAKLKYQNDPEGAKTADAAAKEAAKNVEELAAGVKKAEAALVEANKGTDAAAKGAAEKAVAEVKAKLAEADEKKKVTAARAKTLADKAQPREVAASIYSPPIVLRVAPAPITIAPPGKPIFVQAGQKVEVPVNMTRLFGYADAVRVRLVLTPEVKGISSEEVVAAKDQVATKVIVQAEGGVAPGERAGKLQVRLKVNDFAIQVEENVIVNVTPSGGKK